MTELPDAAVRALHRLLPNWRPGELRSVERLPGGYNNDNYRFERAGEAFVLRVVRPQADPLDRAFEHRLLSGSIGRLAPPLIAFDATAGHMLTRLVRGPLLVDAAAPTEAVARYLHHLHNSLPSLERNYAVTEVVEQNFAAAAAHGRHAPRWISALISTLDCGTLGHVPCHNDLNPWNVIVCEPDPTRWCTLDWEFAGNNNPLFDVLCLAGGMTWPDEQADALIDEYHQRCGRPSPTDRQRLSTWQAYWLREYAWAFAQHAQGNARAEIVAQLRRSAAALRRLSIRDA